MYRNRLTVYLSSTYRDLHQHRAAVAQALRRAGYDPVGMEDYIAEGKRPLARCLEDVRECDFFVGIIALRYGQLPSALGLDGVALPANSVLGETSFTEYEYRQALAAGKKIFMFLSDESVAWPPKEMDAMSAELEHGRRINSFRAELRDRHNTTSFANPDFLAAQVVAAISAGDDGTAKNIKPAPPLPAIPVRDNLPPPTYLRLIGREDQIDRIQQLLCLNTPVICLDGKDGVGKTSVATEAGYHYRDDAPDKEPPHYVAWVAVGSEADKSLALDDVLNLIARLADFKSLTQVSLADNKEKKETVQHLLRRQKFLLIVDNFDNIQDKELRQWFLEIPYPSHVLLVMRSAAAQPDLPAAYAHVPLGLLDEAHTIRHIQLQAFSCGIRELEEKSAIPAAAHELAAYTKGMPRVTKLAILTLKRLLEKGEEFGEALASITRSAELQSAKIYALHRKLWQDFALEARAVLRATPLFVSNVPIRQEALLAACGLTLAGFAVAQEQLRQLLTFNRETNTFVVDADTRSFAQEELQKDPDFERAARKRWSEFYQGFVVRVVARPEPDVLYWRGLVSDSMEQLDSEWAAVEAVLHWADEHQKDSLLLTMVLLLTHYMDSRLLNRERLLFAGKAVRAAKRLCQPYEEGLLRIDALGWTYFEEECPVKAHEEIARGLGLIRLFGPSSPAAWELTQLGLAWQARVKMELALLDISKADSPILHREAVALIEKALCVSCSPWIRYRIFKAAGDIAFKADITLQQSGQPMEALDFYRQAEVEIASYGGEGASYQIAPRIGLAYLRKNNIPQADSYFERLCQDPHMPIIGKLYGRYGQALIKDQQGLLAEIEAADQELNLIEEKLRRYTSSNQLLRLVTSFRKTLRERRPKQPATQAG